MYTVKGKGGIVVKSEFKLWIEEALGSEHFQINPLKGDASFRSYYRIHFADKSYIAMLAPPETEKTDAFVAIAKNWKTQGLHVPTVWAWQPQHGFVLLSDLGDTLLLDILNEETAPLYYAQALQTLLPMQMANPQDFPLPAFDSMHTRNELALFDEWFLGKLLKKSLSTEDQQTVKRVYDTLVKSVTDQPQVVIHRDYHSRNLMVLPNNMLGVIDFQDAMVGPITYDAVSLLKDCYIAWPRENISAWVNDFYQMLVAHKRLDNCSFAQFMEWFDFVGLQRHLKVLGIFSRLNFRDNKPNYLHDIPRIMNYVLAVTEQYTVLKEFDTWLRRNVLPILTSALAEQTQSADSKVA